MIRDNGQLVEFKVHGRENGNRAAIAKVVQEMAN